MDLGKLFFCRRKVDVQDVFNRVIDAKFYNESYDWMCLSLMDARDVKLISEKEYRQAREEIRAYLPPKYLFLRSVLEDNGLRGDFESRLAIYRDWANRPSLK